MNKPDSELYSVHSHSRALHCSGRYRLKNYSGAAVTDIMKMKRLITVKYMVRWILSGYIFCWLGYFTWDMVSKSKSRP